MSIALEKWKKKKKRMPYCWIILVQGFCPLKIEIIQFPDGFPLNIIKQVFLLLRHTELKHKLKDVHGSYVQRRKMNANTSLFFPIMESIKQAQVPKTRVLCQMKASADTRRPFPIETRRWRKHNSKHKSLVQSKKREADTSPRKGTINPLLFVLVFVLHSKLFAT